MKFSDRLPAGRLLIGIVAILLAMTAVAIASTVIALDTLRDARTRTVEKVEPAARAGERPRPRVARPGNRPARLRADRCGRTSSPLTSTGSGRNTRRRRRCATPSVTSTAGWIASSHCRSSGAASTRSSTVVRVRATGPAVEPAGDIERGKVAVRPGAQRDRRVADRRRRARAGSPRRPARRGERGAVAGHRRRRAAGRGDRRTVAVAASPADRAAGDPRRGGPPGRVRRLRARDRRATARARR